MKKETAEYLHELMWECSNKMEHSIELVREQGGSEEEYYAYRRFVAFMMGEIYIEGMMHLYAEYPDLIPPGLELKPEEVAKRLTLHQLGARQMAADKKEEARKEAAAQDGAHSEQVGS